MPLKLYPMCMIQIYSMPGHVIRRLHQISTSVFTERMKDAGIGLTAPQFATLIALEAYPETDQATLAGLIAHDRPTMGGVVERLIAKGLAIRVASQKDRRAKLVSLTQEGSDLLRGLRPVVLAMQSDILPGLTDDERAEFMRLALKAADAGNMLSRAPLIPPKS